FAPYEPFTLLGIILSKKSCLNCYYNCIQLIVYNIQNIQTIQTTLLILSTCKKTQKKRLPIMTTFYITFNFLKAFLTPVSMCTSFKPSRLISSSVFFL